MTAARNINWESVERRKHWAVHGEWGWTLTGPPAFLTSEAERGWAPASEGDGGDTGPGGGHSHSAGRVHDATRVTRVAHHNLHRHEAADKASDSDTDSDTESEVDSEATLCETEVVPVLDTDADTDSSDISLAQVMEWVFPVTDDEEGPGAERD